jgi:hypothetical protein
LPPSPSTSTQSISAGMVNWTVLGAAVLPSGFQLAWNVGVASNWVILMSSAPAPAGTTAGRFASSAALVWGSDRAER